jgi:hypothetical protein
MALRFVLLSSNLSSDVHIVINTRLHVLVLASLCRPVQSRAIGVCKRLRAVLLPAALYVYVVELGVRLGVPEKHVFKNVIVGYQCICR